jgi:ribosomal protein S18 acetylase RimI-like enzyme
MSKSSPLNLIPAKLKDVEVIHQLAYKIWKKHYPEIIGDIQVDYMLEKMYSKETLAFQILEKKQQYFLIEIDGHTVGFVSIEMIRNEETFINKFYILNDHQRNGLGKITFIEIIHLFKEVNNIRLQVNRQNYKAINFYFSLGFKIEKVEDFDIGNGFKMNDFIMLWERK